MKKSIRWGILGAGKIAEKFTAALTYTEAAVPFAIASRDGEKAKQFAAKHNMVKHYDNYESLVKDDDVDIIYIATPHSFHCEQSLLCLEHKKPVLCEKPIAMNEAELQKMIAAAKKNNTFLMEGMWSRFMPSTKKILELIANDIIGPVQYFTADFGFQAPYDPNGRLFNVALGGGSLLDIGVYPIFFTSLLLGEPEKIMSTAKLAPGGADEYCNILFRYKDGATAHIFSCLTLKTSLAGEIVGTKGRIEMHNPFYRATELTLHLNSGETEKFSFPHELNGFEYEIREVMDALSKGLKECPAMPHATSLLMAQTMDKIREQCGIVY